MLLLLLSPKMNILASLHPTSQESSDAFKLDIMCMFSADVPTDWTASLRHVTEQADRHASSFSCFCLEILQRASRLDSLLGQHNNIPRIQESICARIIPTYSNNPRIHVRPLNLLAHARFPCPVLALHVISANDVYHNIV